MRLMNQQHNDNVLARTNRLMQVRKLLKILKETNNISLQQEVETKIDQVLNYQFNALQWKAKGELLTTQEEIGFLVTSLESIKRELNTL